MATAAGEREGLMLIAGEWEAGGTGETVEDRDPGTGEVVGLLTRGDAADVDRAVESARDAFSAWAAKPAAQRGDILVAAAERLERGAEEWAELMTREMGKPRPEALVECRRAARILRFFASEAWRPFGEHYASEQGPTWLFTRREPLGVVGLITPWNFPAAIPAWKLAPALVFGNTVVLKLADDAALTGLVLAHALHDAGLPPGVLNVVVGSGAQVGAAVAAHPDVDAVSFTGSTEVGRATLEAGARTGKRVQLELGGHNPVIVRADADVERAVAAVAVGAFASAGQKCTATRRVYVAEPLHDAFVAALVERAARLRVGYGLDEGTEMGPLVNEHALEGVLDAVARAEGSGTLRVGGRRLDDDGRDRGAYMSPAVFTDLPHDAELACREVFGPVVAVWPVKGDDEALERSNATEYGLSAAVFTSDLDAAKRFVEEIRAGLVHVNSQTAGAEVHVPFGGVRGSAYGPHEQGRAAVEFYTESKTVYVDPA